MAFFVYGFEFLVDHLGVQLRRRNIAMTHQLLNGIQIRTILQQMHCKAVAQCVGRNLFIDVRLALVEFHDLPEALTAHADAIDVYKQGVLGRICHHGTAHIL